MAAANKENKENVDAKRARTYEAMNLFLAEIKSESDRASVILAAAKLDILLYQILLKFLLPESSSTDPLFDGDTPLATFSAKINLAYRLGLIDRHLTQSLHTLRKIRNSFAHELHGVTLQSGPHADRVRQLCDPLRAKTYSYNDSYRIFLGNEHTVSKDFKMAVTIMAVRLEGVYECLTPLTDRDAFSYVPDAWTKEKPEGADTQKPAKPTLKPSTKQPPK